MASRTLLVLMTSLVLAAPAWAQPAPGPTPPRTAPGAATTPRPAQSSPAASPRTGPAPAAVLPPRGAPSAAPRRRSFDQCNREAQRLRLRGSERRHYVSRCQLGYGRPLFRRRGPGQS